jgi:HPt (histidine-containing phosphotransfer) domain-containing protein
MIDKEKFIATKELMGDSFDDFLKLFFSELENDINIIQNTSDNKTITLKAHSQKSSCGLLGAIELQDVFYKIEQLTKEGKNANELILQLPILLQKTKQNL